MLLFILCKIALERAKIKIDNYYASEIDKNSIKVTQHNYPNTVQLGDVLNHSNWELPKIDLLIGGSPCQSLSITQSKTREHLNGKSKLFFEFVDVLKEQNPKWFLFENVSSMNNDSKDIISEIFECNPFLIDSSNFSAQERPRYYWTIIPIDMSKLPKSDLVIKDIIENSVDKKYFYKQSFDYHGDKKVTATLHINGHDILKRVHSIDYKCHTLTACTGGNHQKKILINNRVRKLYTIRVREIANSSR